MLKKVISDESGRILVWTLVMLGIGALLIPTLLTHASANLTATRVTEEGLKELYAANAGVEYALYLLANNDWPEEPFGIPTAVNGESITVTVEKVGIYHMITSTAGGTVIGSDSEYAPQGNLEIFNGALVSSGDISLGHDSTVMGDVYVGGDLTPEDLEPIDGEVVREGYEFPSQEQIEELAERYKADALKGDTLPTTTIYSDRSLGPNYINGDLYIEQYVTVNLAGAIYVEGDITMRKESEFTGSGSIVAVGEIYLRKMDNYGTEGKSLIMSLAPLDLGITFKKETDISALIYAPYGKIQFDKGASIEGAVVGADIQSDKDSTFRYDPVHYDSVKLPGYEEARFKMITYDIDLNSE